jgi:hypothetical protein
MTTDSSAPGPGWHPDPWFSGQHRYWDGRTWTGDVFPDGPVGSDEVPRVTLRAESERPPVPPPAARSATSPPSPIWGHPVAPAATTVFEPWDMLDSGAPESSQRRGLTRFQLNALMLAVGLLLGFVVVEKVVSDHGHRAAASAPIPAAPLVPTVPALPSPAPSASAPVSNDPSAPLLQGLVVRQQDVSRTSSVQLLAGGNQVSGETTLDLCNGDFPSEALRSARLQVVEYDATAAGVLSTEAVLYRHTDDAAQAMREVRSVAAACPDRPVVSPVGEATVTTKFQATPDGAWPHVAGVSRQAYAFTATDSSGLTDSHVAVYLQRGRVLEGVYFPAPSGAQSPVDGQTTIAAIVHVFEQRIAALPASAVSG